MKQIIPLCVLCLALVGCANTAAIVEALGKDTNSVRVVVTTIYGNITVERNIPYQRTILP